MILVVNSKSRLVAVVILGVAVMACFASISTATSAWIVGEESVWSGLLALIIVSALMQAAKLGLYEAGYLWKKTEQASNKNVRVHTSRRARSDR